MTHRHLLAVQRVEDWDFTFPSPPLAAVPTEIFASEKILKLNGSTISLKHYDPAHIDSDISVTIHEADIFRYALLRPMFRSFSRSRPLFAQLPSGGQHRWRSSLARVHRQAPALHPPRCAFGNGNARFSLPTVRDLRSSLPNCRSTACAEGFNAGSTDTRPTRGVPHGKRARRIWLLHPAVFPDCG